VEMAWSVKVERADRALRRWCVDSSAARPIGAGDFPEWEATAALRAGDRDVLVFVMRAFGARPAIVVRSRATHRSGTGCRDGLGGC